MTPRQQTLTRIVASLAARVALVEPEPFDPNSSLTMTYGFDSLDLVEFIMACEEHWPGLEIMENDEAEDALESTILDVAVWLEKLLVAHFGEGWMPSISG